MKKFKKTVKFNGIEFKDIIFKLDEIYIGISEERIVAQYKIYNKTGEEFIGIPTQYSFTGKEYQELLKSINTKTKLLGKLQSLIKDKE